jgi:hypothetical protein
VNILSGKHAGKVGRLTRGEDHVLADGEATERLYRVEVEDGGGKHQVQIEGGRLERKLHVVSSIQLQLISLPSGTPSGTYDI